MVNAPKHCILRDAAEIFTREDARAALRRGYHIHHLADVVRLLAARTQPGGERPAASTHLLSGAAHRCDLPVEKTLFFLSRAAISAGPRH